MIICKVSQRTEMCGKLFASLDCVDHPCAQPALWLLTPVTGHEALGRKLANEGGACATRKRLLWKFPFQSDCNLLWSHSFSFSIHIVKYILSLHFCFELCRELFLHSFWVFQINLFCLKSIHVGSQFPILCLSSWSLFRQMLLVSASISPAPLWIRALLNCSSG